MRPDIHCTSNFFGFIQRNFGTTTLKLMKDWIKSRKSYIKYSNRTRFLKTCLRNGYTPQHLQRFLNLNIHFSNYKSINKLTHLMKCFITRFLKVELNDAHRSVTFLKGHSLQLARRISNNLPADVRNSFFYTQSTALHNFSTTTYRKINNKLKWLDSKHRSHIENNIKEIHYSFHKVSNGLSNHTNTTHDDPPIFSPDMNNIDFTILPTEFPIQDPKSSLHLPKNNWFINLTDNHIPTEVQCLLQLGGNFSLPIPNDSNNKKSLLIEFIKGIEHNNKKFNVATRLNIRNRSIPIINKILSYTPHNIPFYHSIKNSINSTRRFIKDNPNVIFTRADKGNITVALNKNQYFLKISEMLQDNDTYTEINKDPTKSISNNIRRLLTRWKKNDLITPDMYKRLYCSDGVLPRAYGLPKIHKTGTPFRIIISCINSPLHSLASYLQNLISKSIPKASSFIENSFQLIHKIKGIKLDSQRFSLISLDVISLFTNIPTDLAITSLMKRWEYISKNCNLTKKEFLIAIKIILDSTYFTFNKKTYQQKFGTPMGSPLSPVVADIVLQDLESEALEIGRAHV